MMAHQSQFCEKNSRTIKVKIMDKKTYNQMVVIGNPNSSTGQRDVYVEETEQEKPFKITRHYIQHVVRKDWMESLQ